MKLKAIVNLFGGPGTAKSTLSYGLMYELKKKGYNVEHVPEYAKDLVYDERNNVLNNRQLYILAKQHYKIIKLIDKVDFIITDSPLLLNLIYFDENKNNYCSHDIFERLILSLATSLPNINILLERNPEIIYKQEGRYQTLEEARILDDKIYNILQQSTIDTNESYTRIDPLNHDVINIIIDLINRKL